MLKNYLQIAFRNLRVRAVISWINVLGLAIGMAACLVICLFVLNERGYDRMHAKGEHIYRLNKRVASQEGIELHAITAGLMGPTIEEQFPEVQQSTRVLPWFDDVLIEYDSEAVNVSDVLIADSNFFSTFDFQLLRGRPDRVLVDPLSIVLSEATAKKLFGETDPMGQAVIGLNGLLYTVTGIVENSPSQSHLQYNALISWSSTLSGEGMLNFAWLNRWLTQVTYTYLVVEPDADIERLEAKLILLLEEFLPQRAGEYALYLQPLKDLYLHSGEVLYTRNLLLGNITYVRLFTFIAILVLLIACINYMNLTTARYTRRIKEVGVRKVLGARKKQLTWQFILESTLLTCIAFIVALLLAQVFLHLFNAVTNHTLAFQSMMTPGILLLVLMTVVLTGLFAGSYPAMYLSAIRPLQAFKSTSWSMPNRFSFRRVLVVTQFVVSILLIICTGVTIQQLTFMQKQDPGFEREQIIVLPIGLADVGDNFEPFKNAVLQHPNITHAAGSNSVPGTRESMMSFHLVAEGLSEDEQVSTYGWRVDDYDLLDTYGLKLAEGRYFSEQFQTDASQGIVINESLANALGWEQPIGKRLDIDGETQNARVIGVLKDFHFESFHHPIGALALYMAPRYEMLSVRVQGGDVADILNFLEAQWQQFDDSYPFEYVFLDDATAIQYEQEQQLTQILSAFSGLAILIACMGLFGLTTFATQQRSKEIGIRKVIGAKVLNLVSLLARDFVWLVLLAFLIAAPLAYIAMHQWLGGFAFRIELSLWLFLAAGTMALFITLLTVSYHCFRVVMANPVHALRAE